MEPARYLPRSWAMASDIFLATRATAESDMHAGRGPLLERICYGFIATAVVIVSLRMYTRFFILRRPSMDDYMTIFGTCCAMVMSALNVLQVHWGTGGADYAYGGPKYATLMKYIWLSIIFYMLAIWIAKLSILSLYYHTASKRRDKRIVLGVATVISLSSITTLLVKIFQCRPVKIVWSADFPKGCMNVVMMEQAIAILNMTSDIVIIALPIPVALSLKVNKRGRFAMTFIFATGSAVVLVSIARLVEILKWQVVFDNKSWAMVVICSQIEVCTAYITTSLPCLNPLFRLWFSTSFSGSRESRGSSENTNESSKRNQQIVVSSEVLIAMEKKSRSSDLSSEL